MAQQPQTLAYAINDSPPGCSPGTPSSSARTSSADFALTNVMLYWLTGTAASAARLYYEDAHAATSRPSRRRSRSAWPRSPATSAASAGSPSATTATSSAGRGSTTAATSRTHKASDLWTGDVRAFFGGPPAAVAPDPGPAPRPPAGGSLHARRRAPRRTGAETRIHSPRHRRAAATGKVHAAER